MSGRRRLPAERLGRAGVALCVSAIVMMVVSACHLFAFPSHDVGFRATVAAGALFSAGGFALIAAQYAFMVRWPTAVAVTFLVVGGALCGGPVGLFWLHRS